MVRHLRVDFVQGVLGLLHQADAVFHLFGAGAHAGHGFAGFLLHGFNGGADFGGGAAGAFGQFSHFVGHHGKATACSPARAADGGVQRQEVGLFGNVADHPGDAGDLLRLRAQALHLGGGGFTVPASVRMVWQVCRTGLRP